MGGEGGKTHQIPKPAKLVCPEPLGQNTSQTKAPVLRDSGGGCTCEHAELVSAVVACSVPPRRFVEVGFMLGVLVAEFIRPKKFTISVL